MIVAGIDFSLNCPGICVYDTKQDFNFVNIEFHIWKHSVKQSEFTKNKLSNVFLWKQSEYRSEEERYYNLAQDVLKSIFGIFGPTRRSRVDIAIIEGYSFNAKGRVFNIAEATGVLKTELWKNGVNVLTVSPTESKKNFTQKGNAKKEQMIEEFNRRFGVNIAMNTGYQKEFAGSPVSDIVDSYALVDYYNQKCRPREFIGYIDV